MGFYNVVRISDGLGNQIFQYAFARKIQMLRGGGMYLDTRFINNEDRLARGEKSIYLGNNAHREYMLGNFRTVFQEADGRILSKWDYIMHQNARERAVTKPAHNGWCFSRYCNEGNKKRGYIFGIRDCLLPTYFQGYYFNLKYYEDIRSLLQKEIRLKIPMKLTRDLKWVLGNRNTVSLHVRRNDFVRLHICISCDAYYQKAIREMNSKIEKPIYLVFSDDIGWVKENLEIDGERIYVSDRGFADYEEFTIMKHCRNHIIANSTFSYWAAYLSPNQKNAVIYPRNWDKTSIAPKEWICL